MSKKKHPDSISLRLEECARDAGYVHYIHNRRGGQVNLWRIHKASGISYTTLYALFKRTEEIRGLDLTTLATLCQVFGCQPGDLIKYTPEEDPYSLPAFGGADVLDTGPPKGTVEKGVDEW